MAVAPRRRAGRLASGDAILEAAAALFLKKGYAGTSMDDVAALAGVSKQTIYTHFADKERLFNDLVLRNAGRVDGFVEKVGAILAGPADVEQSLRELARLYVAFVIRPEVLQLRRLVIGEASRFPQLASTYYDRVPDRVSSAFAEHFGRLAAGGRLRIPDPALAASHFAALVLWGPLDRALFTSEREVPSPAELHRLADAGVDVFLAAYRPA